MQYARYGFELFLGWDTPTYVWWTEQVYANGPLALVLQGYPNLYILALAGFGVLVGSAGLAERILPFLISIPLAYSYYRVTLGITKDQRLAYLGALLGGLTVNTLRLFSDLHRNLLSFSVGMAVGALIASEISSGGFSWRSRKKRALLLWLPMLAIVAYSQIETYIVLSLTLLLLFRDLDDSKSFLVGFLLVSAPIVVALPLIWSFLLNYQYGLSVLGIPFDVPVVVAEGLLFLGGLALPWIVLGVLESVRKARAGSKQARFVTNWLLSVAALFPVALFLGLPVYRLFYIVPVPLLAVLSIPPSLGFTHRLARTLSLERFMIFRTRRRLVRDYAVPSVAMALVVAATILTSISTTDLFLRPYVSTADVDRLTELAELVRSLGYDQPILVMYGANAANLNPIYRGYFGIELPNSLAYYGKLQYLFSLPNPKEVFDWRYNPSFEMASSVKYRMEILDQLGDHSAISDHAIVVAGGKTYDHPLSESFLSRFRVGDGIYVIPPNQLTAVDIDSWRLFAFSDWTSTTSTAEANIAWSISPSILNWVAKGNRTVFQANYTLSLAQSWSSMELRLRFFDWPQPLIFPDSSTVALSPLEIYFDNKLELYHNYGGQGPITINGTLTGVSSGVHDIRIKSWTPGLGVAIALDEIQLCPIACES